MRWTSNLAWSMPLFLLGVGESASAGETIGFRFEDVTEAAGIRFRHERGASGRRYLVEVFGGGVVVLDYDMDGRPDLFFINGGSLPGYQGDDPHNALYRNLGDGTFVDVAEEAGLRGGLGYGMGGTAADVDNDGDPDLLVTAFGTDLFYRNNGDGTFTDLSHEAGFDDSQWSASASFFDLDGDGLLDLYVCDYLDFTPDNHKDCTSPTNGIPAYCHPEEYDGVADRLYRNRGDGSFENISSRLGAEDERKGKGLGVVAGDYDNDGDVDLYVANDTTVNFLYRNEGDGRLAELGLEAGVGFNEEGLPEAGMGTDWGDFDRDGNLDLIVTNFDFETNTLYRNVGSGFFYDATAAAGMGDRSLTELAFGVDFGDYDNDGWLDLAVVNGHILDNIAEIQSNLSFAQPGQFFINREGRYEEISESVGEPFRRKRVRRGLASLDFDRDGDLDLAIAVNGGAAEIFRNDGGNARAWIELRLVGVASNRDGVGARVETRLDGRPLMNELRAGSSYLSQNEMMIHFGLGAAADLSEVSVRWPSGQVDRLDNLPVRRMVLIKEGVGIIGESSP